MKRNAFFTEPVVRREIAIAIPNKLINVAKSNTSRRYIDRVSARICTTHRTADGWRDRKIDQHRADALSILRQCSAG